MNRWQGWTTNDDAEVQRRYAHARHDGQQDGNEDNDSRQRFHERADDEQEHVDEHQDDDLVLGEAQGWPGPQCRARLRWS